MAAATDCSGLFQTDGDGVRFRVRVTPRAPKNSLSGFSGRVLRVRVAAPPVAGRANEALVRFLSEIFGVPLKQVVLLHGQTGREKIVRVAGIRPEEALAVVTQILSGET